MGKFGWAYIGSGGIAATTAKQLMQDDKNEIVAVWNRTEARARSFAEKFGGKVYQTAEEAINAPGVEGVYIAVTADKHAEFMKLCIKNHKSVLCEKPFTMNLAEAEEVCALAEQEGVYVAEAMWSWHNKVSLQVREWIKSGTIGDIVRVDGTYAFPMLRKNDMTSRLVTPALGGGSLLDIGVYPIRYAYELFGMPDTINSRGTLYNGVDVEETITMDYGSFTANFFVSFQKLKGEKLVITGTNGKITIPFFHSATKAVLKTNKNLTASNKGGHFGAYLDEFTNTAEEIRAGKTESSYATHKATLDTMKLLDTCRRQMGVVFPNERLKQREGKPLNARIKAISHIGFNCKDIQKCMDFYCRIMGCTVQFESTYHDFAQSVIRQAEAQGKPVPGYAGFFEKQGDRLWNVYLKWADFCYIELFDQIGAFRKNVPGNYALNYTHFSLEVENIREFREAIIDRGGGAYIETEITLGIDESLQMWIHDPEGNRFELMEYTDKSYQIKGRQKDNANE